MTTHGTPATASPGTLAAWWQQSGIIPLMHVIVLRRDVYEGARWIARELLEGFTRARRLCLQELSNFAISAIPLPWIPDLLDELSSAGPDGEWWPDGVEANRVALSTFLRYSREQGIASGELELESMFAAETLFTAKS